jgi:hypothetical protein
MNVRLEFHMPLTAAVYWQNQVIMNNYVIKVYMITNCTDPESQNVAFERMKHFVYHEMASTVFINSEHEKQCKLLSAAGMDVTTLPAEPVDQLIGIMLYCKLNAIMEDKILIHEIEISSEIGSNMIYLHSSEESLGPFVEPGWWYDPNLIHCDINSISSDKVLAMHRTGAWRELDLAWPMESTDVSATNNNDGNTVVFAPFNRDETK